MHVRNQCSECEWLKSALRTATNGEVITKEVKEQHRHHVDFIARERRGYHLKSELSKEDTQEFVSLVVAGAGQSKFALPHFTESVKQNLAGGFAVHLVVVVQHALVSQLRLFKLVDSHETGYNHVFEAIYRVINDFVKTGKLLSKLFVQLDNCTMENKNHYLMAYFESLVQ